MAAQQGQEQRLSIPRRYYILTEIVLHIAQIRKRSIYVQQVDYHGQTTPSGKSFATFRVAVERAYAPKDGERETDFFNIRAWGGRAEFVCKYFHKGSMIMLEGERQQRRYTNQNGEPAIWDEIVADIIRFTGEKARNEQADEPAAVPDVPAYDPPDFPDNTGVETDPYPF